MCVCVLLLLLLLNITSSSLLYLFFTCFALLLPFFIQRQRYFCFFSSSVCVCVVFFFNYNFRLFFLFVFYSLRRGQTRARFHHVFFSQCFLCVCVKLSVLPFHSLFSFFLFVFSSFFWDLNLNYLCVNIYTLFILQKSVFFH